MPAHRQLLRVAGVCVRGNDLSGAGDSQRLFRKTAQIMPIYRADRIPLLLRDSCGDRLRPVRFGTLRGFALRSLLTLGGEAGQNLGRSRLSSGKCATSALSSF
jgi:hypothetical protein